MTQDQVLTYSVRGAEPKASWAWILTASSCLCSPINMGIIILTEIIFGNKGWIVSYQLVETQRRMAITIHIIYFCILAIMASDSKGMLYTFFINKF